MPLRTAINSPKRKVKGLARPDRTLKARRNANNALGMKYAPAPPAPTNLPLPLRQPRDYCCCEPQGALRRQCQQKAAACLRIQCRTVRVAEYQHPIRLALLRRSPHGILPCILPCTLPGKYLLRMLCF